MRHKVTLYSVSGDVCAIVRNIAARNAERAARASLLRLERRGIYAGRPTYAVVSKRVSQPGTLTGEIVFFD